MSSSNPYQNQTKPRGEVYVWFTAMGLAIGLVMIAGLLALIAWNGVGVFWPKRVALVTFSEESSTQFRGSREVAGVITVEQYIDARGLTEEQLDSPNPDDRREMQLFVGNRDAFGESFAFFNMGGIESITYPEGIINAERMEWGNALFFPERLQLPDGIEITVEQSEFKPTMRKLVSEVADRRKEINRIERGQIGRINLQIDGLRMRLRFFDTLDELTAGQLAEKRDVEAQLANLQAEYEPLAAAAQQLRAKQNEVTLHYRLANGQQRSTPLGMLVDYYYPNQVNFFQRCWLFVHTIYEFLTGYPREANTEGGIFPAIFGTFVMTLVMSIIVTPFGVLAAIYLREYATQGPLVRSVRIAINNLAGVPSIVFGVFGLGFFIYFVGGWVDEVFFPEAVAINRPTFGTGGILWASLTLALMTVPVVIVATEEALAAVSRGVREGALACGASKWQAIQTLVLPASAPGIITGLVLAMARGAGEVAPLMLVGVVALAPNLPIDGTFPYIHLERKFMHLGFHIYDLGFQSPDSEAAKPMVFATTLVLILLVIILNLAAILVRNHLRKKYSASAF